MLSIFAEMNLIGQHIEYLVRYNDCVIVPGWGAFVANYQPATLQKNNVLLPPARVIGFNSALTHDDGMLVSSIVRKSGVSYDVAHKQVSDAIFALRHQLNAQGEIAISNVGSFQRNDDGAMIFNPFEHASVSSSFIGLPQVNLVPIKKQAKIEEEKSEAQEKDTIYLPIRRSLTRIAASIAVVLCLGFVFSTPIINEDAYQATLSAPKISTLEKPKLKLNEPNGDELLVLNVANVDSTESMTLVDTISRKRYQDKIAYYKQREERRIAQRELIMKRIEERRLQKLAIKEAQKNKLNDSSQLNVQDKSESVRLSPTDKYCLVIASLPSRAHAEEYIENSKTEQLEILEKDGRYRVYAATGESSKATLSNAKKSGLMAQYPKAWVCRK